MIALAANKLIMRLKLPNNALFWISISWSICQSQEWSWDWILKSIIRQFRSHDWSVNLLINIIVSFYLMKNENFDLMINNLTSWKSWILISWNSTSWPPLNWRNFGFFLTTWTDMDLFCQKNVFWKQIPKHAKSEWTLFQ